MAISFCNISMIRKIEIVISMTFTTLGVTKTGQDRQINAYFELKLAKHIAPGEGGGQRESFIEFYRNNLRHNYKWL